MTEGNVYHSHYSTFQRMRNLTRITSKFDFQNSRQGRWWDLTEGIGKRPNLELMSVTRIQQHYRYHEDNISDWRMMKIKSITLREEHLEMAQAPTESNFLSQHLEQGCMQTCSSRSRSKLP